MVIQHGVKSLGHRGRVARIGPDVAASDEAYTVLFSRMSSLRNVLDRRQPVLLTAGIGMIVLDMLGLLGAFG
jgi:hypothetical protein